MKSLTLKLTLLTLIAGTALAPKPMYGMNEKTNVIAEKKEQLNNQQLNQKLLSAAKSGDLTSVKNCLNSGANLNTQDNDGNTPLMWACSNGHTDIVQYLIKNGAYLDTKDKYGWTPLMWACNRGNTDIVQYLVKNRAYLLNTQNNNNQTAYDIAVQRGSQSTVQCLLDVLNNKKLLSASQWGNLTSVKNCLDSGADLNTKDEYGRNPLMYACKNGYTNIVQYLIKNGANVNTQDNYGCTPLTCSFNRDKTDIVQYLVENGAHLNTKDKDGNTPLMLACYRGYTNIVQYLIKIGAHLNIQNNGGSTPLMLACYWGHIDIVQYLVENGAPLNTQNNNNQNAYNIAVQEGKQSIAQYLLNVENELNHFKINPLKLTTFAPESAFIKMLYNECIYYIDTSKYTVLCFIFAKFQNNHNELKKILDKCKFLQCSKEEIKKLKKSGFPLTSDQLDMQWKLLQIHSNHNKFIDVIIE